jgi:oligopeptide transport system ATP-binding protein
LAVTIARPSSLAYAKTSRVLRSLQHEHGFAVFFISHDLDLVGDFYDRVAILYAGRVVESGPAGELLAGPHHPYTRALLDSLPRHGRAGTPLQAASGNVPTALAEPPGCAFEPRCPLADAVCTSATPPLAEVGPGRRVVCYRWDAA